MYIIAEIGSNYNSIGDCILSIDLAKKAGADAVKFQHYTASEMWGYGKKTVTPETWLHILYKESKKVGIDFSCTFFSPEKLNQYIELLDFIKIASSNMMDTRLLDIARKSGKKTLVSTGGHELFEVNRVYQYFPEASFLYCESVYPSRVNNYAKMSHFYFDGVSDHSVEVFPEYPECKYVEKHVNLSSAIATDDARHSLDFREFERFCKALRNRNIDYKRHDLFQYNLLSMEELDMRLYHNVRLVSKTDIFEGECFSWENIGVYRGISPKQDYINPMDCEIVINKKANKFIKSWSPIGTTDIQATQP
jgi:sialic acid synthase SpsE